MKLFFRNNFRWILWGLLIISLCSIPGEKLPELPWYLKILQPDKIVHLFLFIVFIYLMITGMMKPGGIVASREKVVFISILTGTFLAGGTELFQHFCIPGRIGSVFDFFANEAGCFAGWWVASLKFKV